MTGDKNYLKFMEHLRSWILDLPDSESLVQLLETTLTVEEADFLSDFPFLPEKIETLAQKYRMSETELKSRLDPLAKRGVVFRHQFGDTLEYSLNEPWFLFYRVPYWSGERDEKRKKLARSANRYYYSGMGRKFGEHHTMTLRAIPIHRTIEDNRQIRPYEDVAGFIEQENYICVGHCPCRQMKNIDPETASCKHETLNCLHFGKLAHYMVKQGMGKEISKVEAQEILQRAADAGLVHAISNAKTGIDSICNCCSCCCVFMQSANVLGLSGHEKSSYIVHVQRSSCEGCGLCVARCPMKVIHLASSSRANNKKGKWAVSEPERCIGCGVCVHKCPTHSLQLIRRPKEQDVPEDVREMHLRRIKERGKKLVI